MPSTSRKQQKMFYAELARRQEGHTSHFPKMTTQQIRDFTHLKKRKGSTQ